MRGLTDSVARRFREWEVSTSMGAVCASCRIYSTIKSKGVAGTPKAFANSSPGLERSDNPGHNFGTPKAFANSSPGLECSDNPGHNFGTPKAFANSSPGLERSDNPGVT